MGMGELGPIAQMMTKQMLFMDAPAHTRLRSLASTAFTPARVEALRNHIRGILEELLEPLLQRGHLDVINDLAAPLPAIVTAEMLGVPTSDCDRLKAWSADFAEVLGNFQHNPDRASRTLKCVEEMTDYFREAIREQKSHPREGLINSFMTAEIDGDRLTEEEIIANCIVTMNFFSGNNGRRNGLNIPANVTVPLPADCTAIEVVNVTNGAVSVPLGVPFQLQFDVGF